MVQFPSLQPMFLGGMLRKDDHERIAFVGHLQYTAWAIVCPLFFSDLSSALVHKAAWEWLGNSVIVFCARRRSPCWKGDRRVLKDSLIPDRLLLNKIRAHEARHLLVNLIREPSHHPSVCVEDEHKDF